MRFDKRTCIIGGALLAAAAFFVFFRAQIAAILPICLGGITAAWLLSPVSRWIERNSSLSTSGCVTASFAVLALSLIAVCLLLLAPLINQIIELIGLIPSVLYQAQLLAVKSDIRLPEIPWTEAISRITPFMSGTLGFFANAGLALVVAFYVMRDGDRLRLHAELAIPRKMRTLVIKTAQEIEHELGIYLRGQALIAVAVGGLSAIALSIAGVKAALALGLIVGIFNMIPYFGPIIGGIPAVLVALTQGWQRAIFALIALFIVQQIDNNIVSPRITGSVTGLHPALILLGITLGSSLAGITGMLLAIPTMLIIRTIGRNWARRYESV